jgi:hypothetical protein
MAEPPMKPADHYSHRSQELTVEFRKALSALTQDGVVQSDEVEAGREAIDTYKRKMKLLKKEITLDIKTIRASYKVQVLTVRASGFDDKTQRVNELNLQEHQALSSYQEALQQVESALIDADKTKEIFADILEDIEQLEETPPEDALTLEERLLPLLSKWQAVMNDVEHKMNAEHPSVHDTTQIAYWQGIKEGLESALKDLRAVLTENEA